MVTAEHSPNLVVVVIIVVVIIAIIVIAEEEVVAIAHTNADKVAIAHHKCGHKCSRGLAQSWDSV